MNKRKRKSRPATGKPIAQSQRITPFLWFDHEAEEAAKFYVSVFKNSKIEKIAHYPDAGPGQRALS
jgi:predicted 3-demethylubiquinone-9 3-methyltransferase (glyoxalase superfamily)